MWVTKVFKTKEAMKRFLEKNGHKIQYEEIYVNNAYGIEYRKLRIINV